MSFKLAINVETWPIRGVFRISRGARTETTVVKVTVRSRGVRGRGECVPYPRYGESVESVVAQLEEVRHALGGLPTREEIQTLLPAGAARNALDCALWDLEAKRTGEPAWKLADVPEPIPITSAYTISLGTPEEMGMATRAHADMPLLKLKLAGDGDLERVAAVRAATPNARLIGDANESWTPDHFEAFVPELRGFGMELIEQPFPAERDGALADLPHDVPVCADESCHTVHDVGSVIGKYDAVNIKLDKAGGLTEALRLMDAAKDAELEILVGSMVGTSLGVAPATLLAFGAQWVDLDPPLLLAEDRVPGVRFEGGVLQPVARELWG
jgi:L-alanine-DL-glutamate epimerase-like enolase superfamily enzyme